MATPDQIRAEAEDLQDLRLAIADPGSVLPRRLNGEHPETPTAWAARAVVAAGWRRERSEGVPT